MCAVASIEFGRKFSTTITLILVDFVHGFKKLHKFFVDGGDGHALLLQRQALEPLLDHSDFLILASRLNCNLHLVTERVRVKLVEHFERDVFRLTFEKVNLLLVRVEILLHIGLQGS